MKKIKDINVENTEWLNYISYGNDIKLKLMMSNKSGLSINNFSKINIFVNLK